ncbi:nucleotidyltransferase domain-containing protein [Ralstonia pickettii]|nr:nucleotidyltransferase domain-containing protein [Ralstonia pickettii]
MVRIPSEVIESIRQYMDKITSEIPVKKAVLYGSFAKGTFDEDSDIDLAIFSDYFNEISRVKGTTYLLIQAQEFEMDLEPVAFTGKEYEERLGIIDEILKTDIDVEEIIFDREGGTRTDSLF